MSPRTRLAAAMAVAFLGALLIFVAGAAPTVLDGDSAELQAIGNLGGIAHSTGYPVFAMVSRLFAVLGWGDPAFRITFMSSFCSALALSLFVLVLVEVGLRPFSALLGAGLFGSTFSFWSAAERAEVYTLAFVLFMLALWRSIRALRSARLTEALVAAWLLGLTACGHLMFGPLIAVLGLVLAWHCGLRNGLRIPRLIALLAAFFLGLSPYLYVLWVDSHSYPMNYLDLVDLASHPLRRAADFDQPLERLGWLLFGLDWYPARAHPIDLHETRRMLAWGIGHLAFFEPGLLVMGLAVVGALRLWSHRAPAVTLGIALAAVSLLFSALVTPAPRMVPILLMPAVLVICAGAAAGLESALDRLESRRGVARAAGLALNALTPVVLGLAAHATRVHAEAHPFTRLQLRVIEESGRIRGGLIPSMRGNRESRLVGEGALAVIPSHALVVGHWKEMMVLFYLHFVEGRRSDLSFQPLKYPSFLPRLTDWQARYPPRERPIVFLQPHPDMIPHFGAMDSVRSATGEWILIARGPLRGLPPIPDSKRGSSDPEPGPAPDRGP